MQGRYSFDKAIGPYFSLDLVKLKPSIIAWRLALCVFASVKFIEVCLHIFFTVKGLLLDSTSLIKRQIEVVFIHVVIVLILEP